MLKKLHLLATCALLASVSPVLARDARSSVDLSTIDVADIRLGMSYAEVLDIFQARFAVSAEQLESNQLLMENPVTGTRLPQYLVFEADGEKLSAYFKPRIPTDPENALAVSQVIYEIPWNNDNVKAMADSAISKYGAQSNAPYNEPMVWCLAPAPEIGMECSPSDPLMRLSGTRLELNDPSYQQAVTDYLNSQNAVKPRF